VNLSARAWTSPTLDGTLYGEPLVEGNQVFVATEDDTVYALSATTGNVVWSSHLGTPVPDSDLPCGDITPTVGVTGTPVIDPSRAEIFLVAEELVNGTPAHTLVGLDTSTGKVELTQDVDPAGASPVALLQRTGLTLDAGRVVFGMGGNYGDCASYRGRVVSVPEAGGSPSFFTVDAAAGESQGAVWMGGAAPVVDARGNIWVATGNGSVYSAGHAYDDSDAVLELSSSLALEQYFAPSNWPSNNAGDLDMSIAPALLSDGQVVLAGKSRIVYLLNGTALGGIGNQEAMLGAACSSDIDGGVAVSGTTVFLPCYSGVIAVTTSATPPGLHLLWSASVAGGPPIVAAGLVWTVGHDGILYGLNPSSGAIQERAPVGTPANHFPTPSVGAGLLLAPAANRVVAFTATAAGTATSSTTTTTPATTSSTAAHAASPAPHGSGSPAGWIALGAAGVVVLAAAGWLVQRRRRHGAP
jgi:outer membrane protein assembly factor BamB